MNNPEHNQQTIERRGLMFVISSPSGAGKTSLAKRLLRGDDQISMSISMTTRPARPGEIDGKDYFFVDQQSFEQSIKAGDLLEWAEVFGNFYGTPKRHVEEQLKQGRDIMFDIDWQGTQALHEQVGHDLVRVFILPPSVAALEERLRGRGQDNDDVVKKRMSDAANQISHWAEYDYVIINDDLDVSYKELKNILFAERLKRERRIGLSSFVRTMIKEM